MRTVRCPACGASVQLTEHPFEGQFFPCLSCDSILEVVITDPLLLDVYWYYKEKTLYGNSPKIYDLINCPICSDIIYVQKKLWLGDHIMCHSCKNEHQVVNMHPLELDFPFDGTNINLLEKEINFDTYPTYRRRQNTH